ncbi:polysaccharide deacetylase family protein [candidate division KSB1 bacterium]|nr:polysaccharide deacetylase family protein [candidate division KSB1 bacterium]NIS25506.1 polysaccharide deacetylase family protein [candidate division KSB1 bacterium]NIT72399.1 polysaccharide deacetylase family protein [candidate division KSB1 bacterium]NIX72079.1 polysaccharide deacetylase family protein [candidate division KSB1 bacterium]
MLAKEESHPRYRSLVLTLMLLLGALSFLHARSSASDAIPVLCFHYFSNKADSADNLTDTYERFEILTQYLSQNGYESCFPAEIQQHDRRPEKPVILTFDDGDKSQLRAARIMDRYGFKGLFFIIPARTRDSTEKSFTKSEVLWLAERGHRIGAHGYEHQSMVDSVRELKRSLNESQPFLKTLLGEKQKGVEDFAFPFGYYDDRTAEKMQQAFKFLYTVNPGYWDGTSVLIPRMLLSGRKDMEFYYHYLERSDDYRPALAPVTRDGAKSDVVKLRRTDNIPADKIRLFSVSPDTSGTMYVSHPLGSSLQARDDTLIIDLKTHLERCYAPQRSAISYALVQRTGDRIEYLSNGLLNWIEKEPGSEALYK